MDVLKSLAFLLTLLAVASAGILTIAGGGDGVWNHEGVVQMAAPRDKVFEYLTNPARRTEWVSGLVTSNADPAGWLGPQSRLEETRMVDGVRHDQVLEFLSFEEGTHFGYRTKEGEAEIEVHYEVSIFLSGQRSRIDYTYRISYPGFWARVFEPILGNSRAGILEEDFARLSELVESSH